MPSLRTLFACAALGCAGCNAIVSPSEEQCGADADCADRGFENASCADGVCVENEAPDLVWGCLGSVVEPTPDPTKTLSFPIRLEFATNANPVTDVTVDVCDKLDVACMTDDPDFPKGFSPDSNGVVDVQVPEGFDGFVRLTGPEIVNSRVYVGRPLVKAPSIEAIQLLRPGEVSSLALLFTGEDYDPTRGTTIDLVVDCQGLAASGVTFEVPAADEATYEFYLINQSPVRPPDATETDKDGFGGFFNLKPGSTLVRAHRASDGEYIGESSFQVLPDTLSYVLVSPTPL